MLALRRVADAAPFVCPLIIPPSAPFSFGVQIANDTHRTHHNAERHDQTFCHCGLGATPGALRLVPRGQVELDLRDGLARVQVLPGSAGGRRRHRAGGGGWVVAVSAAWRTFGHVLLQFMIV